MDPWYDSMTTIRARIIALDLGIDPARIVVQKVPVDFGLVRVAAQAQTPGVRDGSLGVVISPITERLGRASSTNHRIRSSFGVAVTIWAANEMSPTANLEQSLTIRNAILREFDEASLPEVPEIVRTYVEPGQLFPLGSWKAGFDVQSITIRCDACLPRGN